MAATVASTILDATAFNGIRTFEEQDKIVDTETLKAIAAIFVKHSMHAKLGAGLLHRHDTLQEGSVMLHEVRTSEVDICVPKALSSIDTNQMVPHSWFLNQEGQFRAFEYNASGEETQINPAFASQLSDFLQARGLEERISIIPSPAADDALGDSIEFAHPSGSGTIRIPLQKVSEKELETSEPVVTGWSFHVNEHGIVECKGNNVCAPMNSGNHKVFVDSKPFTGVEGMPLGVAGEQT